MNTFTPDLYTPGSEEKKSDQVYMPIKEIDFDICYKLDQFPEGFECNTCSIVSDKILECKNCHQSVCKDCATHFTGYKKKPTDNDNLCCTVCPYYGQMLMQHQILDDVFKILQFQCQGDCKQIYPYSEYKTHKQRNLCYQGYLRPQQNVQQRKPGVQVPITQRIISKPTISEREYKFNVQHVHLLQASTLNLLKVDPKKLEQNLLPIIAPKDWQEFPQNFCPVENPYNGRLFLIGGGKYDPDTETLYQAWEIDLDDDNRFNQIASMLYPRHGHHACWFGDNHIVVTGSAIQKQPAASKCEVYDIKKNQWTEIAELIQGRFYHASCAFNNQYVYIFCGIAIEKREYLSTIERFDFKNPRKWEQVILDGTISQRQGIGACQIDNNTIYIVGGFYKGRYHSDTFSINIKENTLKRKGYTEEGVFLFQMPIVYDTWGKKVYFCEAFKKKVYQLNEHGLWKDTMPLDFLNKK